MTALRADEIRWSLAGPEPEPRHPAEHIAPPPRLTASRADLVAWWRWRYAALEAEQTRTANLLVQALGEAQSYRQVSQSALDALHDLTQTTRRQSQMIVRLRDECLRRERLPRPEVTA